MIVLNERPFCRDKYMLNYNKAKCYQMKQKQFRTIKETGKQREVEEKEKE